MEMEGWKTWSDCWGVENIGEGKAKEVEEDSGTRRMRTGVKIIKVKEKTLKENEERVTRERTKVT